jgi:hypothetical protein
MVKEGADSGAASEDFKIKSPFFKFSELKSIHLYLCDFQKKLVNSFGKYRPSELTSKIIAVNIYFWVFFVAILIIFNDTFETYLFPSSRHIPNIQHDIIRIDKLVEENSKSQVEIQNRLTESKISINRELAELKEISKNTLKKIAEIEKKNQQLESLTATLSKTNLAEDHDKVNISNKIASKEVSNNLIAAKDLATSFDVLLEKINKGDVFKDELLVFQEFVSEKPEILESVQKLLSLATMKIKNLDSLSEDLAIIKTHLIWTTADGQKSWWLSLWNKVKALVRIEKLKTSNEINKDQKNDNDFINIIDMAISEIRDHNLEKAIVTIQKVDMSVQASVKTWIEQAQMRLNLDLEVEKLKMQIKQLSATPILK